MMGCMYMHIGLPDSRAVLLLLMLFVWLAEAPQHPPMGWQCTGCGGSCSTIEILHSFCGLLHGNQLQVD